MDSNCRGKCFIYRGKICCKISVRKQKQLKIFWWETNTPHERVWYSEPRGCCPLSWSSSQHSSTLPLQRNHILSSATSTHDSPADKCERKNWGKEWFYGGWEGGGGRQQTGFVELRRWTAEGVETSQNKTVEDAVRRSREHIDIDTMERCGVVIHAEPVYAQRIVESLQNASWPCKHKTQFEQTLKASGLHQK